MKYYNITVNGVAYSVSVGETAAAQQRVDLVVLLRQLLQRIVPQLLWDAPALQLLPHPLLLRLLRLPLLLPRLLQALLVPLPSRLPCPATFWMSRSRPVHP